MTARYTTLFLFQTSALRPALQTRSISGIHRLISRFEIRLVLFDWQAVTALPVKNIASCISDVSWSLLCRKAAAYAKSRCRNQQTDYQYKKYQSNL
jgi:hypothetical protein